MSSRALLVARLIVGVSVAVWAVVDLAYGRFGYSAWLAVLAGVFLVPPVLRHFRPADDVARSSSMMRGFSLKAAAIALIALGVAVFDMANGQGGRGALAFAAGGAFAYIAIRMKTDSDELAKSESHHDDDRSTD